MKTPSDGRLIRHFVPADARTLADLSNELLGRGSRPVQFIHMPLSEAAGAPVSPDALAPLADIRCHPETTLYFGIVDIDDGLSGALERARTRDVVGEFGIASECGLGRVPGREAEQVIEILRTVASELTDEPTSTQR